MKNMLYKKKPIVILIITLLLLGITVLLLRKRLILCWDYYRYTSSSENARVLHIQPVFQEWSQIESSTEKEISLGFVKFNHPDLENIEISFVDDYISIKNPDVTVKLGLPQKLDYQIIKKRHTILSVEWYNRPINWDISGPVPITLSHGLTEEEWETIENDNILKEKWHLFATEPCEWFRRFFSNKPIPLYQAFFSSLNQLEQDLKVLYAKAYYLSDAAAPLFFKTGTIRGFLLNKKRRETSKRKSDEYLGFINILFEDVKLDYKQYIVIKFYKTPPTMELAKEIIASWKYNLSMVYEDTEKYSPAVYDSFTQIKSFSTDIESIAEAIYRNNTKAVKILLPHVLNINEKIEYQYNKKDGIVSGIISENVTLLHLAIACSNYGIAQTLLQAGIDVNIASATNDTPLHTAIQYKNIPIIKLLLDYGADPYRKNAIGFSPLAVAYSKNLESTFPAEIIVQVESPSDQPPWPITPKKAKENTIHQFEEENSGPSIKKMIIRKNCLEGYYAVLLLLEDSEDNNTYDWSKVDGMTGNTELYELENPIYLIPAGCPPCEM